MGFHFLKIVRPILILHLFAPKLDKILPNEFLYLEGDISCIKILEQACNLSQFYQYKAMLLFYFIETRE